MRIISHRGNLTGREPEKENTVEAIEKALSLGYDVEIDMWYSEGSYWLGHDGPDRKFDLNKLYEWCKKGNVYLHCKNPTAIQMFIKEKARHISNVYPFFHDKDPCILLDDNVIWVHPTAVKDFQKIPENCIAVLPNCKSLLILSDDIVLTKFFGVCTDYPENVRNSI